MFVENTPIPNLQSLLYQSDRDAAEIVSAIASSYRTLISIDIVAEFESSAGILKIVKGCSDLESLFDVLGDGLILERSDILAIASLPRLCCFEVYCRVTETANSALVRCRGLMELRVSSLIDPAVLAGIGMNLVVLDLRKPSREVVDGIVGTVLTFNSSSSMSWVWTRK